MAPFAFAVAKVDTFFEYTNNSKEKYQILLKKVHFIGIFLQKQPESSLFLLSNSIKTPSFNLLPAPYLKAKKNTFSILPLLFIEYTANFHFIIMQLSL